MHMKAAFQIEFSPDPEGLKRLASAAKKSIPYTMSSDPQTEQELNAHIVQNARGISIIYLMCSIPKEELHHTPLDYHCHLLFWRSPDQKTLAAMNLDTKDVLIEAMANSESLLNTARKLSFELARKFVDRINSALDTNQLTQTVVRNRAGEILWDQFNRIKTESYIQSLQRFRHAYQLYSPMSVESSTTPSHYQGQDIDTYGWATIAISEERFLTSVK